MKKINPDVIKDFDRLLEKEVKDGKIPGSSILMGDMEGELFHKTYGAVEEDTIFCLCSMTKPITAVAALRLMDQGVLHPYEPVASYLPSYAHLTKVENGKIMPVERTMRLSHLLHMTSGLIYPVDQMYDVAEQVPEMLGETLKGIVEKIDSGEEISYAQACDMVAKAPLAFEPGTKWAYGLSADVLGGVVEAASGMSYRDYIKTEILEPLGMEDTDFLVPEEKLPRIANIMSQEPGNPEISDGKSGFPSDGKSLSQMPYITSAGGGWVPFCGRGLYSTLQDYSKLCRMLLNLGTVDGRTYLSGRTVKQLTRNHLTETQSVSLWPELMDGYGYGNLMRVMVCPECVSSNGSAGEFGWDGFLGTYFFIDLKAGIYFIYMQQGPIDWTVRFKMCRMAYSALQD